MEQVSKMSKVLCALGVGILLGAGIVGAANYPPYSSNSSRPNTNNVISANQSNYAADYMEVITMFQQQFPNAAIKSISYDAKHHPYYEIEGYTPDQQIELKVDEESGQTVAKELKPIHKDEKHNAFNPENIIVPKEAEMKAMEKLGNDFQTMEWTVEPDGNKVVYEFEMTNGGDKQAEVKIDALSGKVLSSKVTNTKH